MNKLRLKQYTLILVLLACILSISSCGNKEETLLEQDPYADYEEESIFDDPKYDAETDGANPQIVKKDVSKFYGAWDASSSYAQYLYGNINLVINEDGTWTGNITDEKMSGKWKEDDKGITLTNDLVCYHLFFDDNGTLLFQDDIDDEVYLVLDKPSA